MVKLCGNFLINFYLDYVLTNDIIILYYSDFFHIGIRDSQGAIAEFASFGLRLNPPQIKSTETPTKKAQQRKIISDGQSTDNDWNYARPVHLFSKMCDRGLLKPSQEASFNLWWDHTLKLMFETPKVLSRFSADNYESCSHNCFTFVLAFLKSLRIKALDPWLISRSAFTQEYLLDDLKALRKSKSHQNV